MHVMTMEGLLGAGVSAKLTDTPMRAAGAAERRGDTGSMERALGYAGEMTGQAEAYQKKAAEGMEKEAEEAKKEEAKRQEELAEKRAEEKAETEARTEAASAGGSTPAEPADSLEISGEGKQKLELDSSGRPEAELVSVEPGGSVYTAAGEILPAEPAAESLSVSV